VLRTLVTLEAVIDYSTPGPLTSLEGISPEALAAVGHDAVDICALLRHRGVRSRVRCGFATYFQPNQGLDHWITEYWSTSGGRWVRLDSEILGEDVLAQPEDLRPGAFLSGGEAWTAFRRGDIDAATFGVYGTDNWGPAEIRGNAVKDLAALNKAETLPWDEWGYMTAAFARSIEPEPAKRQSRRLSGLEYSLCRGR
jgi:hypothetical protein